MKSNTNSTTSSDRTNPNHNYYRYRDGRPYHLSVGAVIVNDKQEVFCHYFKSFDHLGVTLTDFYILMRETMEPGETPEAALLRGCQEEMGATVTIEDFLGSIVSHHSEAGYPVEKTTLYYLCRLLEQDDSKRSNDDPERGSQLVWRNINALIKRMSEQSQHLDRTDLDESAVLKRL